MLLVKNMGPQAFKKYIEDKDVYIFGAGRALESCVDIYFENKRITGIIDNGESLWGKTVSHNGEEISIESPEQFENKVSKKGIDGTVLFISSPIYAADIVEQLDKIAAFDGLDCFLQVLVRNTMEPVVPFEFTQGTQKIPKKIHYIWVGGKSLPDEYTRNIETWRKWNPDYEIIRWDETNYDFGKCDYVREAYETKNWGFVPNFVRLDIIYECGGIYLDTDVEAIRNFDVLLNDEAFICMGCADRINQGCGFGAVKGNNLIGMMRDKFYKSHFLNVDGKPGKRACHTFINPVVKQCGFQLNNQYQRKNGVVLYPSEVMSPLTIQGLSDGKTDKTVSIHQGTGSWRNEKERLAMERLETLIRKRVA